MKKLTVVAALVSCILLSLSFINEDPKYKNLKVLSKNTTEAQMDSIMKHFSRSLGVKCNFCHVRTQDNRLDFVSDENKHKEVSRNMMKMTNRINRQFFKNESVAPVTCFSCHNGKEEPMINPPQLKEED